MNEIGPSLVIDMMYPTTRAVSVGWPMRGDSRCHEQAMTSHGILSIWDLYTFWCSLESLILILAPSSTGKVLRLSRASIKFDDQACAIWVSISSIPVPFDIQSGHE